MHTSAYLRPAIGKAFTLCILNALDAAWTIRHTQRGAEELNPLMLAALQQGPDFFIAVKILGMALLAYIFIFTCESRFSRLTINTLIGIYAAIVAWHVTLELLIRG